MRLLLAAVLVVLGAQVAPFGFPPSPGWSGADAAYSVELSPDRLLWLFGDTFVGPIVAGRRQNLEMIHNSFAVTAGARTEFDSHQLAPVEPGSYYWPSDGTMWNGRLWLFFKKVRNVPGGPPGLDFDWWAEDLLEIVNPQAPPPVWRMNRHPAGPLHPGIACLVYQGQLYAYGLRDGAVVLMRYTTDLEPAYYDGSCFQADPARASALFAEGASEMSVFPYQGEFLAVYTRGGLGPSVVARTAPAPEGPWSEPVELYRAAEEGLLLYAGKAHRTLSSPGHLLVSYCRNLGALEAHRDRPDVYFPQFVEVKLR